MPKFVPLGRLSKLPKADFDAQYPEFKKKAEAANALAAALLPAMDRVITKETQCRARLEMLLAAIAVAEGGPERLMQIRDPFGDGPFKYREHGRGFELSSKLMFEGKPVKLVVGQVEFK